MGKNQFVILSAVGAFASTAGAQAKIPVRMLPAATATSTDTIASIAAVRQLPNGNVLVNDQTRRRLIMLDKDMKFVSLVADSTSSTNNAYGVRPGGLMAYRGDSTLFIEPAGLSMLVIDPAGKIIRTMAAPRPNDVQFLIGGAAGNPGFDAQGRLIYRTVDMSSMMRGMRGMEAGKPAAAPTMPDTAALVRFDLATRKLDTVGFYKILKPNMSMTQDANGGMRITSKQNPLPVVDEWAVMSDGAVAFVRGQDYHIDYVEANGKVVSTDKIPYEWQRMTDDDKQRFLDSTKVAIDTRNKAMAAAMASGDMAGAQKAAESAFGGNAGGGAPQVFTMMSRGGGDAPRTNVTVGPPGGAAPQLPEVEMVPISDLSDYKPVFGPGSVRADMDGRLWIRTIPTKPTTGGAIYEVIDRSGKLVDRIQVPAGTTIAGFGQGQIVYLGVNDEKGRHIQRIPLK